VDQIIRGHGGRIEVESAPGEGSTFTLVLPSAALLASRPAELPAKREVEAPLEPTRQTGS
jgi:hypothetical protein